MCDTCFSGLMLATFSFPPNKDGRFPTIIGKQFAPLVAVSLDIRVKFSSNSKQCW
jgi:hypothetical protein